jgi:rhodanese-related sulfurtransferase
VRRRFRRTFPALALAGLAFVLGGCGGSSSSTADVTATVPAASVELLGPEQAQALVATGNVQVLDVRTPEEYAERHLADASLIDFYAADFTDRIGALDRDTTYVVYCRSGHRSGQATALMAAKGFTAVNDVDGGIIAWEAAGLPVISPPGT